MPNPPAPWLEQERHCLPERKLPWVHYQCTQLEAQS